MKWVTDSCLTYRWVTHNVRMRQHTQASGGGEWVTKLCVTYDTRTHIWHIYGSRTQGRRPLWGNESPTRICHIIHELMSDISMSHELTGAWWNARTRLIWGKESLIHIWHMYHSRSYLWIRHELTSNYICDICMTHELMWRRHMWLVGVVGGMRHLLIYPLTNLPVNVSRTHEWLRIWHMYDSHVKASWSLKWQVGVVSTTSSMHSRALRKGVTNSYLTCECVTNSYLTCLWVTNPTGTDRVVSTPSHSL